MSLIIFACVGFLLAVLWTDLAFDRLALPYRQDPQLPEIVLADMAAYYRRVTSEPWVLGGVMLIMLGAVLVQIIWRLTPLWLGIVALVMALMPIIAAGLRVIPIAQRLGLRRDSLEKQSELALSLFPYHLFFLFAILIFSGLQACAALTV
jgi:hypothetical protein